MKNKELPPIHPGEILLEEFLDPMGISQYRLAKDITVPPRRINEIVHDGWRCASRYSVNSAAEPIPLGYWLL